MIDYKIGEEPKKDTKSQSEQRDIYGENEIEQLKYIRNICMEYHETAIKQRRYTNFILTLLLILLFIIAIPQFFKIVLFISGYSALY